MRRLEYATIDFGCNTEEHHKRIDEAIAELEALQQPKSCAKCKSFKLDDEHNDGFGQCFWGIHFPNGNSSSYHKGIDFYCSEFEAKEQ